MKPRRVSADPGDWSRVLNLVVAVPGKWTTAWHCGDRVVNALEKKGQLS
ncbi:hypothetical protein [Micromonospora peucetia]|nr:hypothetical protein [Micromonospora peucetia]